MLDSVVGPECERNGKWKEAMRPQRSSDIIKNNPARWQHAMSKLFYRSQIAAAFVGVEPGLRPVRPLVNDNGVLSATNHDARNRTG